MTAPPPSPDGPLADETPALAARVAFLEGELESLRHAVAHDLRAPLRAVAGFTDLALESAEGRLDAESLDALHRVRRAAGRMSDMIDVLLALARLAGTPPERRPVDVSALAARIVERLRQAEPQRAVRVEIEPGLAAHADAAQVETLLACLVGNAWKFTARSAEAFIGVGRDARDGEAAFLVRDNGAGFAATYASRLFRPFSRLHAEREFPGIGGGLAIARQVVLAHGGRIEAQGTEGAGAVIRFTLGG